MATAENGGSARGWGWNWFKSFQYDKERDSTSDARNVLLIVAALITAVTFQAGVNPPGGVWQDSSNGHTAWRANYATHKNAFYVFLISNTLALSSAILVIASLTYNFPFHFEISLSTFAMIVTYASALFAVTPHESIHFRYILFSAALPFLFRIIFEWGHLILPFFRKIFRACCCCCCKSSQ